MIRRGIPVLVLLVIALSALFVHSRATKAIDPVAVVRRAYASGRSIGYSADVVTKLSYCGRDYKTASTVRHLGDAERIDYPSGAAVVSNSTAIRTYDRRTKQIHVSSAGRPALGLLLRNYTPVSAGDSYVAGRLADIVDLAPKYPGNPSKRMWVDRKSGVVLKTEDRSSTGELRSTTEFKSIRYDEHLSGASLNTAEFTDASWTTVEEDSPKDASAAARAVGFAPRMPRYIPAGYVPDGMAVYDCGCPCGHKALAIRYTNGLNGISVYEEPDRSDCPMCRMHCGKNGACMLGDTSQARTAVASARKRSIIVVSDLPSEEIAKIAESAE